jgi:arylsulfatase A-like enzyme
MTGRWSHEVSGNWHTPLDGRDSTLAEVLAARGYRTGGMVANLSYTSRWTGLDRGFAHYAVQPLTIWQVLRSAAFTAKVYETKPFSDWFHPGWRDYHRKSAREINEELLRWLDRSGDRPFFAFLNYLDAHEPYLPLAPFDTAFSDVEYPPLPPAAHGGLHKDDRPRPIRPYDQGIAYIDAEITRLKAELERRGLWENTLVIVTSDHGEEFGEHGIYGHGHTLYLPSLHVPLIMALPGTVPAGVVVEPRVSLRDLAATILAVTHPEVPSPFPGQSLARFWHSDSSGTLTDFDTLLVGTRWARNRPDWDATSRGDLQGLLTGRLAFMRDVDLTGELYDLAADSTQRQNLVADPAWAGTRDTLNRYLDREVGAPDRAH